MADYNGNKLQVFSLSGEHRRDITGAFWRPCIVKHFDGRLYVVENEDPPDEIPDEVCAKLGKRIFVLTPQGETLQVYDMREGRIVDAMAVVGRKLIVCAGGDGEDMFYALVGA